jgi:hypothetical protein
MIDKSGLAKLLRIFTATIENLNQEQIDQLILGKGRLMFAPISRTRAAKNHQPPADQASILARLNDCRDREEARRVLSAITNRDSLAGIARELKVHVVKQDKREDVESKIIEFVIGGKLRTEAIQSLNLKGGSNVRSEE